MSSSFSLLTMKMLWGRAAGMCSMPECHMRLYEDATETDDAALIGENCHIVADSVKGPRGDNPMPMNQRNKYNNLILLCGSHHTKIDKQEFFYTIEKLHKIKADHETWVRASLTEFDAEKQNHDEQYSKIADEWSKRAHLDEWLALSSQILSDGQPKFLLEIDDDFRELKRWLLGRIWPGRYPTLEKAFHTFRHVLDDFHNVFHENAELQCPGSDWLITPKFYKMREFNHQLYHRLLAEYEDHVDLVDDLMLELTRAANLVCDEIRIHILRSFRLNSGRLIVQSGPGMDLSVTEAVVQYADTERMQDPIYPGLEQFKTARVKRDYHYGGVTNRDERP